MEEQVDNTVNTPDPDVKVTPPIDPPKKKALYDKMVADKLYSKSFDEFSKQFSTPDKVSKLHDYLSQKGKYDKGLNSFEKQFFSDVPSSRPVADQPVKKKEVSASGSPSGSPTSGGPSAASQNTDPSAGANLGGASGSVLDAQAVAGRMTDEHIASQQKQAVKNPVKTLVDDYSASGSPATGFNLNNPGLSMPAGLQPTIKPKVTKEAFDDAKKHGREMVYNPQMEEYEKLWSAAHNGQKQPNPEVADQGDIKVGHPSTIGDKFIRTVLSFDAGVIKGVADLSKTGNDIAEYSDKLAVKLGLMDKGTAANNKDKYDSQQAELDKGANLGMNEEYVNNSVAGGLGKMIPVLLGGESKGAFIAGTQAWGSASETVDKMKANGVKFENGSDIIYKSGSALFSYFLMKDVLGTTLLKSVGQETFNGIVGSAAADATKDLADKGIDATAQDFANYYQVRAAGMGTALHQFGISAVTTFAKVGRDFAAYNLANTGLKAMVNALNKTPIMGKVNGEEVVKDISSPFYNGDTPANGDLKQFALNLISTPAAAFSALHMAQTAGMLFDHSPYLNPVIEDLRRDHSPESVQSIKDQLGKYGEDNGWTPEEIQATHAKIDELADIAPKIPKDIHPAKFNQSVNLIMDRRHMEGVLEAVQAQKAQLDPTLRSKAGQFEELLNANIEQANDRLNVLVTDKPFTYFEHQGQYFKVQQEGEPVKITKARYDLEGVNNERGSLAAESTIIEPGKADKNGILIPEKDDETSKSKPAKAAVSEPKKEPQPVAQAQPVKAVDENIKDNAKPESPEAVTPKVEDDHGKVETKTETQKGDEGRQGLLTPEKTGAEDDAPVFSTPDEADRHWIKNETDPEAIASYYHQQNFSSETSADYKEHRIHDYLGDSKINADDFSRYSDDNLLKGDASLKRRIDSKNSQLPLDVKAQELSNDHIEVTPQDIVDFINKYKNSEDFKERAKTQTQKELADRYAELTGGSLTNKRAEEAFNKQQEKYKDVKLSDDARQIIEREGITPANIDKLKDQFKGFPYTEEDFDNVKRYLDEQAKQSKTKGGVTTASPGTKSEGVEQKPAERKTTSVAGLTPEQQKVADGYNKKIGVVTDELIKKMQQIDKKLQQLSERNNLFGDDEVAKNPAQQSIMGIPLDVSAENVKAILDPIHAEIATLERELADLQKQRDTAIGATHQQRGVFDTPTDDAQEKEAKKVIGASGKIVSGKNANPDGGEGVKRVKNLLTDDKDKKAIDEIRKRIREKLHGPDTIIDMSTGSDDEEDELLADGIKLTRLYFKAGIRSFPDFAGIMIEDMGETIVPYLKSFYEVAKNLPGQAGFQFDATDVVDYHLAKLNEIQDPEQVFVDRIKSEINAGNKMNITHLEGIADQSGLSTNTRVHLQEFVERALIEIARDLIDNPMLDDLEKFNEILDLYNKQPALNQRSSTRVLLQQYSTPMPYAFAAGLYVNKFLPNRVYDPTAGTGMLGLAFDPSNMVMNEIDPLRVKILQQLGYNPTTNDAVNDPSRSTINVAGVMANPPFGASSQSVKFHDYTFDKLDYIIPLNALKIMKPEGRAAIIIGGHNEYDAKGALKGGDFKFLNHLYHYFNVADVINVDGGLYAKQGTTFPTRLILINGKKEVPQDYAPAYDEKADKPVKTFEDLYNRIQERNDNDENPRVLQSRVDVQFNPGDNIDGGGAPELFPKDAGRPAAVPGTKGDDAGGAGVEGKEPRTAAAGGQTGPADHVDVTPRDGEGDHGERQLADVPDEVAKFAEGAAAGTIGPEGSGEFVPVDRPVSVNRATADQLVKNEKVPYTPASRLTEAGSVIPSNMAYETEQNLKDIEQLYGPIDTFVANELGYHDLDDLNNAFFAEQVDAIAMAIHQLKLGKGMIVGDMTGIGKGRIAAGLIRWVVEQGEVPTFFTENADLFSDIYRDLHGIGSGHLTPFIVNDPSSDRDANVKRNGKVIYNAGTIKDKRQFFENKKVPRGTKVVLCTYSQLNSEKQTLKRGFISHHTKGGYMFLDESHNVAGASNSGMFFQDLLEQAKGAAFFSATYAKRADNMPVYALKTSMSDANMTSQALVDAIQMGGNALQEIVASQLVSAGQMIRRERDFTGVENTFTTLGVDDKGEHNEMGLNHRELADQVIDVCNAIIDFEKTHVVPAMAELEGNLRKKGQKISQTKSKALSVANTPFASKMFNVVNQMLFSIKAPALAQEAIREIRENNRKPVISFNSTMESFIKNGGYKPGDEISDVSFSASLHNGLKNTLKYRIEYPNGDKYVDFFDLDELGDEAKASWNNVESLIKKASADMSISPIDNIIEILEKEGLHVGEITGRSMRLKFNEGHTAATVEGIGRRDTTAMLHNFNNDDSIGDHRADVLLLNASGATGFSMHADKSFRDQRQRVMINGQFELDINKEIQKRGRIDRTNQVQRGAYTYVTTAIPAETRLAMMVSDKLKKLQANTAGDQKSKANEMKVTDFLNDYGDQVITDYLKQHPDIYDRLFHGQDPAGIKDLKPGERSSVTEGIARKTTGRAALLKVSEQEAFYNEVAQSYNDYIDYLNSTDQNTLAVKSINLEAKTLSKGVYIEGKHTQSPFGKDSVLEKVEANVLRKPLSKEELESEIEHSLDGKTPIEAARALEAGLNEHYSKVEKRAIDKYTEVYEDRDERDKKKYVGNPQLYNVAKRENDDQYAQNIEYAQNDIAQSVGKTGALFRDFRVGSEHMVPSSMAGNDVKYTKGIFLGFHFKEKHAYNPFAPSNILMKFAVLDGKRTITVSTSRTEFVNALYAGKAQLSLNELKQMGNFREKWEEVVKDTRARETRYIVTGNILQAFRPNLGQLVSYTTAKGTIDKGILLPKDFNPGAEGKKVGSVGMFEKIMALKGLSTVTSASGDFVISRFIGKPGDFFKIEVPKSTKAGGKYFKNDALLDIVDYGEFETVAGVMRASIPSYKLMDLLKVLEKEFSMKFNSGIVMENQDGSADDEHGSETSTATRSRKPADDADSGEHELIKGKSTERIQAANILPTGPNGESLPVKKLPDIISDLVKGLNVKVFYAKSKRKNAAGSYAPASGGIKLGVVNNLDVAIHEVGHALDDRFSIFDTIPVADHAAILDELQWFADRGGSNPQAALSVQKKIEYLKREGIAEFVRAYAINDRQAFARAPKFAAHFEATVPDEALEVVNKFGQDYLRYINSTALDSIMANIEEAPKGQVSAYRKFVNSVFGDKEGKFQLTPFDKIQIRLTNSGKAFNNAFYYMNDLAGFDKDDILPEKDANIMARLFAGVDAKVGSFFKDGLVTGKNEPIIDARTGQRMNMEWLYGSFDSTSEETIKQDQALTIGYLFAMRTIEKAMQFDRPNDISGISAAGDKTDTDIAVNFLVKEFGQDMSREQKIRIMDGARRYQLWADKMLNYMVDKGRMSRSTYNEIKEKNLEYVAFLPVQENAPGIENSFDNISSLTKTANVGNVKTVIREMTGSTMYKRHPYISLMQNTAAMVKEADRNEILQSFIDPMVKTMRGMGEGKVNPFANVMMEVSAAEKAAGKPVIMVYKNGNAKFYMFSEEAKDVYNYIKGLSGLPKLPGVFTAMARAIRFTATRSPIFAKNHLIRSTFNRLILSRTGSGLGSFISKDKKGEQALYRLYGADQTGYWLGNRIDYYKLQNQVIKNLSSTGNTFVFNPAVIATKGWDAYNKLLHQSDLVNRMAERRSAYKHAVAPVFEGGLGYDEYNAQLYASLQSRDTLDAAVSGTWTRYINQIIPFFNVEVQGLKRNIKAATEGDFRSLGLYALRIGLYTLLPTLIMRLLAKNGDYEEEYDNLPAYQRDLGWNFKLPGHESWFYIPKPYDSGLLSSGMDRAIGASGQYGDNAWHGFDKTIYQDLLMMKPEMSAGPFAAVVEPMTNYSFFKQGPIVPRYEEDKILSLRHSFNEASRLGKAGSWALSPGYKDGDTVDPRYIDNFMQTMFSYYGDWGMSLSDIGSKESRHKFGWKTTGFIKDQQIYGDSRVEKLYDVAKELGLTGSKPIKALAGVIREYYDATDPNDRKKLHTQIMQMAKDTYSDWMGQDIYKEKIESKGKKINFN